MAHGVWNTRRLQGEIANSIYSQDTKKVKRRVEQQKKLLLKSKLPAVLENSKQLSPRSKASKKVLNIYTGNQDRTDYKRYLNMGTKITGSRATESAHQTVIQERMKLFATSQ